LALTGLLVALAAVMVVWLGIDRRPPEWDHANHLERAVACHRSLAAPGRDWRQEIIGSRGPGSPRGRRWRRGAAAGAPGGLDREKLRSRLRRLPMPVSMAPIRIHRERLEVGEDPAPPAAATKESR
jgi:hypothetical protein